MTISTEMVLPSGWEVLPHWAQDEIFSNAHLPGFYRRYIEQLVNHSVSMGAVWRLFDKRRNSAGFKRPFNSLVRLMHQLILGPDPGQSRTRADRRNIAGGVEKHVQGLLKNLGQLRTAAPFAVNTNRVGCAAGTDITRPYGLYPAAVESQFLFSAVDVAQAEIGPSSRVEEAIILNLVRDLGASAEDMQQIAHYLGILRGAAETRLIELFIEPRRPLRVLASATREWAETCAWARNDVIWHIGTEFRSWFGGNQHAATASLATVMLGEEITTDSVDGIMKRRAVCID